MLTPPFAFIGGFPFPYPLFPSPLSPHPVKFDISPIL